MEVIIPTPPQTPVHNFPSTTDPIVSVRLDLETTEDMIERIENLAPILDQMTPMLEQVGPILEKVVPILEGFPSLLEAMQYRISVLEEKTSVLSLAYDVATRDVIDLKGSISVLVALMKKS